LPLLTSGIPSDLDWREASVVFDGRQDASGAGIDDMIVLRPADITLDVIETGGTRRRPASVPGTIRRHPVRTALSIVAAISLVVVATQLGQRPDPSPEAGVSPPSETHSAPAVGRPSPTANAGPSVTTLSVVDPPPVDVVIAAELRTAGGLRIDLSWAGPYPFAVAVSGGWLVHGSRSLWFLDRSGEAQPLLWQIDFAIVGRQGWVAWQRDGRVGAARLDRGWLVDRREVESHGYFPLFIIGGAVVMVSTTESGAPEAYDLWRPQRGAFEPRPRELTTKPFGLNHAGTALLGVEPADNGRSCLVELNPETFAVIRRACVLPLAGTGPYTISPDGRWLLLNLGEGSPSGPSVLIDLNTVFAGSAPAEAFPSSDEIGFSGVVWVNSSTFVAAWEGTLRSVGINSPNIIVEIPLTDVPRDGPSAAYVTPVVNPL
jgi:hypothetical protein